MLWHKFLFFLLFFHFIASALGICGDGILNAGEQCDLGTIVNALTNSCCTALCQRRTVTDTGTNGFDFPNMCNTSVTTDFLSRSGINIRRDDWTSVIPVNLGASNCINNYHYTFVKPAVGTDGSYTQRALNTNATFLQYGGYACTQAFNITFQCGQSFVTDTETISARCCGDGKRFDDTVPTFLGGNGNQEQCDSDGLYDIPGTRPDCCTSSCTLRGFANATVISLLTVPIGGATYVAKNTTLLTTYNDFGGFDKLVYVDSADTGTVFSQCNAYTILNPRTINAQIQFAPVLFDTTCDLGFTLQSTCNPFRGSSEAAVGNDPGSYFWSAFNVTRLGTCGNGVVDNAGEQCDLGVNNGAVGSCCSATCQRTTWTTTVASQLVLPNCLATSALATSWLATTTISTAYVASVSINSESCAGTIGTTSSGPTSTVDFPAAPAAETCNVNVQFTSTCGQTQNSGSRSVLRYCCGDGVATPGSGEICDVGGNNGVAGSCCSSSCTLSGFNWTVPVATSILGIDNCLTNLMPLYWFTGSTLTSTYWHNVTVTAENCTGTPVGIISPYFGVSVPPLSGGISLEFCSVTAQVTSKCGTTLAVTRTVRRTCCGDNITVGSEQCDLGSQNGATGSCCYSSLCNIYPLTTGAVTNPEIQNCNSLAVNFTDWFPSPSVSQAYWASQSIVAQNCTPAATYSNGVITFPAMTTPQVCYVTANVVTRCSESVNKTRTFRRTCCGDSITSGSETCDQGSGVNGLSDACCNSNCSTSSITFTADTPSTFSPLSNCGSATIPYTTWFPTSSINPTYWSSVIVQSTTCTGSVTVSGANILFTAYSPGQTCTVTLLATASCGQTLAKTMTVVRTCCGNGAVEAGEVCDSTACCTGSCTFQLSNYSCRSPVASCDQEEFCTGASGFCPPDQYQANTVVCNTTINDCTTNVTCTGLSPTCPANFISSGTPCHFDSNYCFSDTCSGAGYCNRGAAINYNDGQFCNGVETCNTTTGTMIPGTPPNCDDNNSCTTDACNNGLGACSNVAIVGTYGQCGSSNLGTCQYGNKTCNGTGPSPVVTCVGNIEPANETCGVSPVDTNCNGLVGDGCPFICTSDANCSVVPRGACQDVRCNVANLTCYTIDKPTNTSCNDGLACTTGDRCYQGDCIGDAVSCEDNNECTLDLCTEPGGVCTHNPAPYDGTPCVNEANLCSTGDLCNSQGMCVPGIITMCPNDDQCNTYTCDPETGDCVSQHGNNACNDGLGCTINDACRCGTCSGHPIVCDDHITCTNDVCQEPMGTCGHILQAGHCLIQGQCYANGVVSPEDPCQLCNTAISVNSWSWTEATNVSCNDLNTCTENDLCVPNLQVCMGTPVVCPTSTRTCHEYICDSDTKGCVEIPVADGTACDTGYFCITDSTCLNGYCQAGNYRDCSGEDSPCTTGTCLEFIDLCLAVPLYANTECDPLFVCDGGFNCIPVDHPPCPEDSECMVYVYDPLEGCVLQNPLFQTCTDNNACTIGDYCAPDYICVPGNLTLNCNDNDLSTADYCLADGGCVNEPIVTSSCDIDVDCPQLPCRAATCLATQCVYTPQPDGTRCDDNDVCNGAEVCYDTVCVSGTPINYNDTNPCTLDSCDPVLGVSHVPLSGPYDDGNACTDTSSCVDGEYVYTLYECPPDTECLYFQCMIDPEDNTIPICMGIPYNQGGTCSDAGACTTEATCDRGVCSGQPVICPPPNECTIESFCDFGMDACDYNYYAPGTPCNLDDLCNTYMCDGAGSCLLDSVLVTCTAIDQCHDVGICIPDLGICTTPLLANGTPCDDGDACSSGDFCNDGTCVADDLVVCAPLDQCHLAGICNTTTGVCTNPKAPDGSFCEDSSLCSEAESCVDGVCVACGFLDCNVTNPCLIGHCNATTGCYTTYNDGVPCDDGDDCTTGTTCLSGSCPSATGTLIPCNNPNMCGSTMCMYDQGCMFSGVDDCTFCIVDSDCPYLPCHKQHCNATSQQCYFTVDDTQTVGCTDGQFCNGLSQCHNGACYRGPPPNCDDDNSCTYDYCNITLDVCTHTPLTGNVCFSSDHCVIDAFCSSGGACLANTTINCAPAPVCHYSLGCDTASGECEYGKLADGTPCDDGNPCTLNDACTDGRCVPSSHVTCGTSDVCQQEGYCNPQYGECFFYDYPDGTPCDNGLGEPVLLLCDNGVCDYTLDPTCDDVVINEINSCQYVEYTPFDGCVVLNYTDGTPCTTGLPYGECTAPQDLCMSGECTRSWLTGQVCRPADDTGCDIADLCIDGLDHCPNDLKEPDGTPCPGNNSCIVTTCLQGDCAINSTVDCSYLDTNVTDVICSPTDEGCVTIPPTDGTPCDTGDPITQCVAFDVYIDGICTRFYQPSDYVCDDGNNCTNLNFCSGIDETCVTYDPNICTVYDSVCTVGVCNQTDGVCYPDNLPNSTLCNYDDDLCTVDDHCEDGLCIAGDPIVCVNSTDPCYTVNCSFGACVFILINSSCGGDFCDGGCTYPREYWQHYNMYCRACEVDRLVHPWPLSDGDHPELFTICGQTYYQWMIEADSKNAFRKLVTQWITVLLNVLNGACIPIDVQTAYDAASTILAECETTITVTQPEAENYKELYDTLLAYNTGTSGPGVCDQMFCGNSIMTMFNTIACVTSDTSFFRRVNRMTQIHALTFDDNEDCGRGVYDLASMACQCDLGWSGKHCDQCAEHDQNGDVFMCVPSMHDSSKYILRSIPSIDMAFYLSSINGRKPSVMPGTWDLDCACNFKEHHSMKRRRQDSDTSSMRSIGLNRASVQAWSNPDNTPLIARIEELGQELEDCEFTWNINNTFDNATTTVFVNVTNTLPHQDNIWVILFCTFAITFILTIIFLLFFCNNSKRKYKK